jgi:hypothetical protein
LFYQFFYGTLSERNRVDREMDIKMDRETNDSQIGRRKNGQADGEIGTQTERQIDRH